MVKVSVDSYLVLVYDANHEHQSNCIKTIRKNCIEVFVNYCKGA